MTRRSRQVAVAAILCAFLIPLCSNSLGFVDYREPGKIGTPTDNKQGFLAASLEGEGSYQGGPADGFGVATRGDALLTFPQDFQDFGAASFTLSPVWHCKSNPSLIGTSGYNIDSQGDFLFPTWASPGANNPDLTYYRSGNDLVRNPWVKTGRCYYQSVTDTIPYIATPDSYGFHSPLCYGSQALGTGYSYNVVSVAARDDEPAAYGWANGADPSAVDYDQYAELYWEFDFELGDVEDETAGDYYLVLDIDVPTDWFGIYQHLDSTGVVPPHSISSGPYFYLWVRDQTTGRQDWDYNFQTTTTPFDLDSNGVQRTGATPTDTDFGTWYSLHRLIWIDDGPSRDVINAEGHIEMGFGMIIYYEQYDAVPDDIFDWATWGFQDPGYIWYTANLAIDYISASVYYAGSTTAVPHTRTSSTPVLTLLYKDPQASSWGSAGTSSSGTWNFAGDYSASREWKLSMSSRSVFAYFVISPALGGALYLAKVEDNKFDLGDAEDGTYLPLSICGEPVPATAMPASRTRIQFACEQGGGGLLGELYSLGAPYYIEDSSGTSILLDLELTPRYKVGDVSYGSIFDFVTYQLAVTYWDFKVVLTEVGYTLGAIDDLRSWSGASDLLYIGPQFTKFVISDGPFLTSVGFTAIVDGDDANPFVVTAGNLAHVGPGDTVIAEGDNQGYVHWESSAEFLTPPLFTAGKDLTITITGTLDSTPPEVLATTINSHKDFDGDLVLDTKSLGGVTGSTWDAATDAEELSYLTFEYEYNDDDYTPEDLFQVEGRLYWRQVGAGGSWVSDDWDAGACSLDLQHSVRLDGVTHYLYNDYDAKTDLTADKFPLDSTWAFWAQLEDKAGNWRTTPAYFIRVSPESRAPTVEIKGGDDYAVPYGAYGYSMDSITSIVDILTPRDLATPLLKVLVSDANLPQDGSGVVVALAGFDDIKLTLDPDLDLGEGETFTSAYYYLDPNKFQGGANDWEDWVTAWESLAEGEQDILIKATDTRNNPGYFTLPLYKDLTPPAVSVKDPADISAIYIVNAPFGIEVQAVDAVTDVYIGWYTFDVALPVWDELYYPVMFPLDEAVDGVTVTLLPGGSAKALTYSTTVGYASHVFFPDASGAVDFWPYYGDGEYLCTVGALDSAFNVGYTTFLVRKDTVVPVCAISLPGSGAILSSVTPPAFQFSITEDNLASIQVSFTGGISLFPPVSPGSSAYSLTMAQADWASLAKEGPVAMTVTASDGVNVVSASVSFIRDVLPPRLALALPVTGSSASSVAPSFQVMCVENYLTMVYYTLDDGATTRPIVITNGECQGVIDQLLWDAAWAEYTTIKFVAIDEAGNIASVSTTVKREDWFARSNNVDLGMFEGMPWQLIVVLVAIAAVSYVIVDRSNRRAAQKVAERPVGRTVAK